MLAMHRLHRLLLRHGRQPLPERQLIRRGLAQDVKNGLPKEAKVISPHPKNVSSFKKINQVCRKNTAYHHHHYHQVVVVGGGAVGASTAYHLAKIGAGAGVLLLEVSFEEDNDEKKTKSKITLCQDWGWGRGVTFGGGL